MEKHEFEAQLIGGPLDGDRRVVQHANYYVFPSAGQLRGLHGGHRYQRMDIYLAGELIGRQLHYCGVLPIE